MADLSAPKARGSRGFALPFDAPEARRQLHLSIGLVTMLSIGIVSAGVAVGGHPVAVKQDRVASRMPVIVLRAEANMMSAKQI